jgi:hypothetical protein
VTQTHGCVQEEATIGVVQVSIAPLVAALAPQPPRCIAVVHGLVPRLAARKHDAFMSDVAAATARLGREPQSIQELAEHVQFVVEVGARRPALDAAYEDVLEHYALCKVRKPQDHPRLHLHPESWQGNAMSSNDNSIQRVVTRNHTCSEHSDYSNLFVFSSQFDAIHACALCCRSTASS